MTVDGRAVARGRTGLSLPLPRIWPGCRPARIPLGRAREPSVAAPRTASTTSRSDATVELAEISGSETFVHVHNGDLHWVVQEEGVHEHALGEPVQVYLDPARLYAFDRDGTLEAAPVRAVGPGLRGRRWPGSTSRPWRTPTSPQPTGPQDYALKPLQFAFEDGGAYALLGPSGCGKTTLLNIISGLLRPERGPGAVRRQGRDARWRRRSATSPRCSSSRSSTTP